MTETILLTTIKTLSILVISFDSPERKNLLIRTIKILEMILKMRPILECVIGNKIQFTLEGEKLEVLDKKRCGAKIFLLLKGRNEILVEYENTEVWITE
jgi:hypothetical protein